MSSETEAWKIHSKSECVMTVVPTLAAASQADYEVVQPRPPGYGNTVSLPLGSGCLESLRIDTLDGSPPAEIKISRSPDRLQTEISAASTEMACGSRPAHIDICEGPDRLQREISVTFTEMTCNSGSAFNSDAREDSESPELLPRAGSVTAVVSEKWMERFVINQKLCVWMTQRPTMVLQDEVRMSAVLRAYRTRYLQWYLCRQ